MSGVTDLHEALVEIVRSQEPQHHVMDSIDVPQTFTARPLTDVDVRDEETDDGIVANGRIEFSTFSEGEYVESVFLTRERALELYHDLGRLLGVRGGT